MIRDAYRENTLRYDEELCTACGMCMAVCPHGVFGWEDGLAAMENQEACMECGACALNCASGAIQVESGVGCAYAMMKASLFGSEESCCCGGDGEAWEEGGAACRGEDPHEQPGPDQPCCGGEEENTPPPPKSPCCG
jgi:NAD-dependent dihydropyrimidine dehydrogenase PreA subunit